MQNFQKVYGELNTKQREAVDQIEGPVMVLAGPGTGKTQLLGARVANILNLTDVNPGNILCLTYTEAGVSAMRSRLASLIGSAGYQVSVQTFHSFALEVFRRFPDYFLDYRGFQPVDDLSRYEVIKKILQGLPPSFKLAHRSFGRNDSIKDLVSKIAELKKAGLTPKEAMEIADQNFQDLEDLKELLDLVPNPLPKKKTEQLQLQEILANYLNSKNYPAELNNSVVISNLKSIVLNSLAAALLEAQELQKNTPITAWKGATLEKTSSGNWKFKDLEFNQNLQEVAYVYEVYSKKLIELEKLEFEDMILNLINGLSIILN
jgi:DNA helicase-2/ATP-dependent DNA helicase PcrA